MQIFCLTAPKAQARLMAHAEVWFDPASVDGTLAGAEAASRDFNRQPRYILEKRHLNDSLPIHQLPVEILIKILYRSLQGNIRWYFSKLHTLWQVCTTWSELILAEPTFWGMAQPHYPQSILTTALQKSKNSPLDVQDNSVHMAPANDIMDFLGQVIKHVGRWRSAEFDHPNPEKLDILASLSAPTLEDLTLFSRRPSHAVILFRGELLHRLRHLTISVSSVRWEGLANLETLMLNALTSEQLSVDQLLGILSSSPGLTKLALYTMELGPTKGKPPPVELGRLEKLAICDCKEDSERNDLIASLRVPNCTDLTIRAPNIHPSMTHVLAQCRAILLDAAVIKMSARTGWGESLLSMTTWSSSGTISSRVSATFNFTSDDPWYISILPSPPLPKQEIILDITQHIDEAPWEWILRTMTTTPQISVLNVTCDPNSLTPEALVTFLGTSITADDGGGRLHRWPLPKLHSLRLTGGVPDQISLTTMLCARYRRRDLGEGEGEGGGPSVSALTSLRIVGTVEPAEADVQALRDILGPDTLVEWKWPKY